MKNSLLLLGSLLLSSVSLAQINFRDCDMIPIGNTGMSYNIKDITKAIRANNYQKLKVVEVDIFPKKIRNYNQDSQQMIKSAVLIQNSKDHLAPDKYKHVVGGAIISYGTKEVARFYFKDDLNAELKSTMAGIVASTVTGILKEVRDSRGFGNVEAQDAIATSLGGALVAVRYNYKF